MNLSISLKELRLIEREHELWRAIDANFLVRRMRTARRSAE